MFFSTLFMAAVANAHLFIQSPSPIAGSAPKNPLSPDGSDFPCHGVALPGSGGMSMPVGSTQPLIFDTGNGANTAVHGGGSCQISVTYETDSAKIRDPKNWYVIHSIEGGCPTNSPANLGGSWTGPSGSYDGAQQCNDTSTNGFNCVNQFNFQLPKGMKDGQATLAWTWFNAVGNREMYMNCVAIDITGGASDDKEMQELPGLFVANLEASDLPGSCRTTEMTNVAFPQPGPVLEQKKPSPRMPMAAASSQFPISSPSACPNMARNGNAAQPSIVSDGPATYVQPPSGSVVATAAPTASLAISIQNKAKVNDSTGGPAAPTDVPATGSSSDSSSESSPDPSSESSSSSSSASSSGSCAAGSVQCSNPGALVCPDSQHYGICDIDNCAVIGTVAAGTQCKDGVIAYANTEASTNAVHKRLVHYARYARHAHHRRS